MPSKRRVQTKNRVKTFKPKARTGCVTCRIRRVKCDEAKPNCQKCTSTGRKCDGYLSPRPLSNNSPSPIIKPHSPEYQLTESDQERRSFQFFCTETVRILSGVFNPIFWTRLVRQATHHEPAIRHAAIALGALHQNLEISSRDELTTFAMQQYGKAIRCLVKPIQERQKQAADVALITCVLFISFETMRGHLSAAVSHVEGGVKIICELQSNNRSKEGETWSVSPLPYVEYSVLNPIFLRLDRQASEILPGRKRLLLDQVLDNKASGYDENIPLAFTSIEQARNSLDHMRTFAMRFVKTAASEPSFSDSKKRSAILQKLKSLNSAKLQQWSAAFVSFIQNNDKFDIAGQVAIHVLEMHRIVMGMVMEIDEDLSFADGTVWDQYEPQFKSILSHAVSVNDLYIKTCEEEGYRQSIFSLDAGVGFPLFFAASSCRDGVLRRKAIALLKAVNRQEGMMNSLLAARILERFMSIEEEGLIPREAFLRASEIPRENRLASMKAEWITDGQVHLSYRRMGRRMIGGDGFEGGDIVVEEWIEW